MLSAVQAKEISLKASHVKTDDYLTKIFALIELAAHRGEREVSVFQEDTTPEALKTLRELMFKIHCDPYGPMYVIRW